LLTRENYIMSNGLFPLWLTHIIGLFAIAPDRLASLTFCVERFLLQLEG
jgi:hypothetical protein